MPSLFDPVDLHGLTLSKRIAMAPLTRSRATKGEVPCQRNATYYGQRASAGRIITEAANMTQVSCAFEKAPGIYSDAQVEGWTLVTNEVHSKGGHIFLQLWHCGRVGADGLPDGAAPLSPSRVDDLDALQVWAELARGRYVRVAATPSRAMTTSEVEDAVERYHQGAASALRAGSDEAENHAANGYLPHQFLSPTTNRQDDKYGGSLQNRMRFLREVVEAAIGEVGAARVGVRISPFAAYDNTRDPNPPETYAAVASMVDEYGVAYVHLADTNAWAGQPDMPKTLDVVRSRFREVLIGNGGITPDAARDLVATGALEMIAFGRPFLANPDLPARIRQDGPYNEPRNIGWYGGTAECDTGYPTLAAQATA